MWGHIKILLHYFYLFFASVSLSSAPLWLGVVEFETVVLPQKSIAVLDAVNFYMLPVLGAICRICMETRIFAKVSV